MRGMLLAGLTLALTGGAAQAASTAVRQEAWTVAGLNEPAELIVDRWGIPHIYARNTRDAFFLQGYNAARDRLWQIDLWRKRGLGRLSASFGPAYVDQDRAARLFLYRGDMAAEWAAYAPDARTAVEAFASGINAYVAEVRAGTKPLPVEFGLTASQPEDWSAQDVLRIRSHALVSNATQELARARTLCAGGAKAEKLRRRLEPTHEVIIPEGLDPCDVPADVLKDYLLGTATVSFDPMKTAKLAAAPLDIAETVDRITAEGSNNWVIAGSRTATGRPILANDPHRAVGAPSLRYIAHIEAPGLSIIGSGEPAAPGVSFGHNGRAAFGLTIFAIDQEDLYAYQTDGDRYRYKDGWEPMTVLRETIEVKGQAPREVELRFTRHGPVLHADAAKKRAFALRTVWNQPGMSGYFASSWLWGAKSWSDFEKASQGWGAPSLNLIYADTDGTTGWAASGVAPVRANWDGLLPVPGDGRYEWAGFQPAGVLPSVKNPKTGFFATANEMNLPADYPNEQYKIAFEYGDRSRIDRITEVLAATPKATLAGSMALQNDNVSVNSRRLTAMLVGLSSPEPRVQQAIDLMRAWNNSMSADSAPAAIAEVWAVKHLAPSLIQTLAPEAATAMGIPTQNAILSTLEEMAPADRAAIMLKSLPPALDELSRRMGPDMSTWRWGRLHHARFEPAVAVLADPQTAEQMSVGPLQTGGSGSTPHAAGYRFSDFRLSAGATVRVVLDVGAWDNSMAINAPGQSADPASPHYRDLFPLWAAGSYVPLRYTRPAVEADAETIIRLTPKR
ncbi:penicillin acylase family protein [Caulobacter sp. NIBR2454]|uniref:penicillin acylase family protein n=1 Tax=Caulobacter sp. NIBR2454 TaxID=3015996 RepID=UPI0022B6FC30|nr:penicillin acylase family protein [Caulobacter sp. NIBR2454]